MKKDVTIKITGDKLKHVFMINKHSFEKYVLSRALINKCRAHKIA